ncbi:MAG TPA: proteasome assembly chaperone family protein [Nitrososphaerales archaeon]|nr:proteasome assembly chaperone family protein [Nitrososphaerales archaeon]
MSSNLFETSIVELVKTKFNDPIVFGGFLGPGFVGPVAAGYMIEKLNLHEIAHVRSQHIPPVAVFIGAKLRHPFRIYSDANGKVIVMTCEMPIMMEGLYEISSVLLDWFEQIKAKEVILLEGLGVNGIPVEREPVFVADESKSEFLLKKGIKPMESALISGVGGSILNQCLTRKVTGLSLMTVASVDMPDPGAALTIVNAINTVYGLGIPTDELEESSKRLNEQLGKLSDQYKKLSESAQEPDKRLYG